MVTETTRELTPTERTKWAVGTNRDIFNSVCAIILLACVTGVLIYCAIWLLRDYLTDIGIEGKELAEVMVSPHQWSIVGLILGTVGALAIIVFLGIFNVRRDLKWREDWTKAKVRTLRIQATAVRGFETQARGMSPVYLFDVGDDLLFLMFGCDLDTYAVSPEYEWDDSEVPDKYRRFPSTQFEVEYESVWNRRISLKVLGQYLRPSPGIEEWEERLPSSDSILKKSESLSVALERVIGEHRVMY
jgi:hypothetical protein